MKQIESFFWGIIAACGAIVAQFAFLVVFSAFIDPAGNLSYADFFALPSFIIAISLIEESFKYLILAKRIKLISFRQSFLTNAFLMGMGFFAVELALILKSGDATQIKTIVEIAAIHLGTAVLMGYFILSADAKEKRLKSILFPLLIATAFHGAYNLLVSHDDIFFNYIKILLFALLVFIDFRLIFLSKKTLAQD